MVKILTPRQELALSLISKTNLAKNFYFSGGTALSHYYLQHRFSEDLDFFSEQEFDPISVTTIIKSLKEKLGFIEFDYQNSFNRNLYFLHFDDGYILKVEFTYYPFKQVEKSKIIDNLFVDSSLDIAVNKLFTIVQKARGRDYYDLYFLIKKYGYEIAELRMMAKQKFDWHIDALHLATKLFETKKYLDDPILNTDIQILDIDNFFEKESLKLKDQILKK